MRTMSFDNPNWEPLERAIRLKCAEFMWMWREDNVEFYNHIHTRRYLHLDSNGRCYREGPQGLEGANLDEELKRVFEVTG